MWYGEYHKTTWCMFCVCLQWGDKVSVLQLLEAKKKKDYIHFSACIFLGGNSSIVKADICQQSDPPDPIYRNGNFITKQNKTHQNHACSSSHCSNNHKLWFGSYYGVRHENIGKGADIREPAGRTACKAIIFSALTQWIMCLFRSYQRWSWTQWKEEPRHFFFSGVLCVSIEFELSVFDNDTISVSINGVWWIWLKRICWLNKKDLTLQQKGPSVRESFL